MVSLADIEEMFIYTKTFKRDSNKAIGWSGTVFATPDLILILKQWWESCWEMRAHSVFVQLLYSLSKLLMWAIIAKSHFFGRCSLLIMLNWPRSCIFFLFILRCWDIEVSLLPVTLGKLRDSSFQNNLHYQFQLNLHFCTAQTVNINTFPLFPTLDVVRRSPSVTWLPVLLSCWLGYAVPTG